MEIFIKKFLGRERELREGRRFFGRKTHDIAIPFRMGAGFPGDVTRSHPMTIEPALMDATNPIGAYGLAALSDGTSSVGTNNTVRGVTTSDSAITSIYGILVRTYPIQASSASNYGQAGVGAVAPPPGACDVLKAGYIIVKLGGSTAPIKGGQVYLYYGSSTGSHVQGGFEAASGSNLIALDATGNRIYWNGPADANGYAELVFNP